MSSESLAVGPEPGNLTVRVTKGDTLWTGELVLYEIIDEGLTTETENVIPWPAAPTLHFEDSLTSITATLSTDVDSSVANAVATWTMNEDDIDERREGEDASIKVSGETWFTGGVKCRS